MARLLVADLDNPPLGLAIQRHGDQLRLVSSAASLTSREGHYLPKPARSVQR